MNTIVTSKEEILKTSREMIRQQGWSAISIRSVAAACGVSVGSIYNYFDSKSDLVGATVESVWCEIFHRPEDDAVFHDVQACIVWMYERMAYGCRQYPGFFTLHSVEDLAPYAFHRGAHQLCFGIEIVVDRADRHAARRRNGANADGRPSSLANQFPAGFQNIIF